MKKCQSHHALLVSQILIKLVIWQNHQIYSLLFRFFVRFVDFYTLEFVRPDISILACIVFGNLLNLFCAVLLALAFF
jgi:hypothetical protein